MKKVVSVLLSAAMALSLCAGCSSSSAPETEAQEAETQAAGAASTIYMIVMLVIMFALMYFLMIRPQKKEQKRVTAMLNDMEVGDAIVTTGGFYGVIIDITDEDVIVEFGNNKNCRIPMKKAAIAEVEKASDATA